MNSPIEILLVEDNPEDLTLTLRALKKAALSNRIHVCRDGEEALDFIFCQGQFAERQSTSAPRLILLDLKLPKIDGLEVIQKLKADPLTKHIPIVALTSSKQQTDIVRSYSLGVNSYIVKPVDFERFVDAVRDLGMYWLLLNEAPKLAD